MRFDLFQNSDWSNLELKKSISNTPPQQDGLACWCFGSAVFLSADKHSCYTVKGCLWRGSCRLACTPWLVRVVLVTPVPVTMGCIHDILVTMVTLIVTHSYLFSLIREGLRSKDYSKVEDLYDTRVPLHNEDAFGHGLRFKAKVSNTLPLSE